MSLADLGLFDMERPNKLTELCAVLAEREAAGKASILLAGGTDWVVEQELAPTRPAADVRPLVFDISRLDELRGIALDGDVLSIGSATSYWEMRQDPRLCERAPLLERMASDVGAVQIQARGTLGGNLATGSPAADGVAALAAYDAVIHVQSARGARAIPFADLQTGYKTSTRKPDEVITRIELKLPPAGTPWLWRKVGTRRAQAISKVALAAIATVEGETITRLGLGMASVAPVTSRMTRTRALAATPIGKLTQSAIEQAVDGDVTPIDDVRSTSAYRRHAARGITVDWFRQLGAPV